MPTVREATHCLMRELGLTTIFGNPGSTELPLFRDFPADFRYVLGLQESVVVGMADGYAQATGNAALVNLHSAAGVGHAMGNIFTAYRNRTPMVITAGQQARSILPYEPFLFATDAAKLPEPYVKWAVEPARGEDVPLAIARAYYLAMQEPCGPTFVSIPVDDWDRATEAIPARTVSRALHPDPALAAEIAALLDRSERPVFVVGFGVDRNGAWDEVVALAERHQASVWVSPMSSSRRWCATASFTARSARRSPTTSRPIPRSARPRRMSRTAIRSVTDELPRDSWEEARVSAGNAGDSAPEGRPFRFSNIFTAW